jgi:hypothetical protein
MEADPQTVVEQPPAQVPESMFCLMKKHIRRESLERKSQGLSVRMSMSTTLILLIKTL